MLIIFFANRLCHVIYVKAVSEVKKVRVACLVAYDRACLTYW